MWYSVLLLREKPSKYTVQESITHFTAFLNLLATLRYFGGGLTPIVSVRILRRQVESV